MPPPIPNPLTEAHYTFADGYLIAGPTRALVARALQVKAAGTSIARSAKFLSMEPRDGYVNFSAVIYQNLGTTLAPLAGLLSAFGARGGRGPGGRFLSRTWAISSPASSPPTASRTGLP